MADSPADRKGRRFPPFALDRTAGEGLGVQLTEGMREAIRIGFYRPGDLLPAVNPLADRLGVSEIVVRRAYRQLVEEGLLSARRRIGHCVRTSEKPLWRGHVLCVMTDHDLNPQLCVIVERIRRTLAMKGFLFSQVTVLTDVKGAIDFSGLDVALSRPLDFVITIFRHSEIEGRLSASGLPFAVVGGKGDLAPGCVGGIAISAVDAIRKLAHACRRELVSEIEVVACPDKNFWLDSMPEIFRAEGIRLHKTIVALPDVEGGRFDAVKKAGFDFVQRRFAHHESVLPQLYVVTDDFLAAGMLVGFMSLGIDIPRDVRFVSFSNGGFGPFYSKSVSKIEHNSGEYADEITKRICDWLFRRKPFPASYLKAKFIFGDTFRR